MMGEIADMMLEGDLCEGCGVAMDGEGYGIPRYCSDGCAKDRGFDKIAQDGTPGYTRKGRKKNSTEQCLSIKITYSGKKLMHAILHGSEEELANKITKLAKEQLPPNTKITGEVAKPKENKE